MPPAPRAAPALATSPICLAVPVSPASERQVVQARPDGVQGGVVHANGGLGAEEEADTIVRADAFERLSDAAKAKYLSGRPGSAEHLQRDRSTSPPSRPPAGGISPSPQRKNWLSQQVQGYGMTLQDHGASPEAVAYSEEEHLRNKPRVLSAPPRIHQTVPLHCDEPASPQAVRSLLEKTLALELEICKPVSNELSAGLRVESVHNGAAARAPLAHQLKVGDVILLVQDYRVDGIPPKLLADAISSFAAPSVLISSSHSELRLVIQRPSGVNQHGGRNWEQYKITILPGADKREYPGGAANPTHTQPNLQTPSMSGPTGRSYQPADWSDALDFANKAHDWNTEARAEEFMRRQQARKQLEVQVEESLKEALAQLHDIEKKDAIEHKEWAREPQGASDPRGQDASARAQRLLEEEQALDYERLRAENVRLQQERAELELLRVENLALKEGTSLEVQKHLHAERVEKERLMAENQMLRDLLPKVMSSPSDRQSAAVGSQPTALQPLRNQNRSLRVMLDSARIPVMERQNPDGTRVLMSPGLMAAVEPHLPALQAVPPLQGDSPPLKPHLAPAEPGSRGSVAPSIGSPGLAPASAVSPTGVPLRHAGESARPPSLPTPPQVSAIDSGKVRIKR